MNQGQPQYPPQYMAPQPAPRPNGGNKTMTYVLIGVIAVLVIALVGGLAWHLSSENKHKEEAEKAAIQQTQDSLKAVAAAAQASADSAKQAAVAAATTAANAAKTAKANTYRGVPASEATRVVINGHGVRMRTGPGKQYPFPQTWDGHAYTVSKGTSLPFLGDYGGWYAVRFEGGTYYVSSQFAYLAR